MSDDANLQHMALFVEVARARNFTRASAKLGVPTPTTSRAIAAMERRFGVRLFDRTTRKVELTDAGQRYFDRCAPLVDAARLADEVLREAATLPTGLVRVSMPVDFGVQIAGPLLAEFALMNPGISLDLDLSPQHSDLISEHVDVAIRFGAVEDDSLVARRLGWIERSLFASGAYLQRCGTPQQPDDLAEHQCILVLGSKRHVKWRLTRGENMVEVAVGGRVAANNHALMQELAERGLGIAALTPSLVRAALRAGRLVPILQAWSLSRMPVNALTTSRLQPACVRALIDFLSRSANSSGGSLA